MTDRSTPRFDHVGVIVRDINAVAAFFVSLGFEADSTMEIGGEAVGRITGLTSPRSDVVMVKSPNASSNLELIAYHEPDDGETPEAGPANRLGFRHVAIEVGDAHAAVERARADGYDAVGEVVDYGGFRLVYVRGPEGLIVELAEKL